MNREECIEKAEDLLIKAEAAFELAQDPLAQPEELNTYWQRGSYRVTLANGYIGLAQVKTMGDVSGSLGEIVTHESKQEK